MSTEILREFLIAVGFKTDESSYKRASDAIDSVEKKVSDNDKRDRERVTAEGRRHEVRKRNAEGLALALGGVATAAAAAATVVGAAMVKMAGGFDSLYFVSQRTGASANNLKSLGYAFSQVGSTAESALQAVESFAKARRTNPGINAMLRGMGVDTRGDTSDVLMRGVDAIQARHPYYTGAQVAGLLGISEDQFQTLTKYKDQIKAYREEYTRTQRVLNVNSDETARASASVQRSLGSLSATVGVLMEKLYTTLAPVLERIVKGFQDWLAAHPEQVEKIMRGIAGVVETVGNTLTKVGDWLGDEQNQKKLTEFWEKFSRSVIEAAKQLREFLETLFKIGKFLGLGGDGNPVGTLATRALGNQPQVAEGDTSKGKAYTPLLQRGWNAVKRGLGFGPKQDNTDYKFDGKNADVLRAAAKELGTSPEDLATVISYESKFRPGVWGGKGGNYMGLIQFGPEQRATYGANDKQSFSEQMPAVVRYLKSRGFKPGMGLDQLYATINGGNPYVSQNASDGNGTIGQHVARMRVSEAARVKAFLGARAEGDNRPIVAASTAGPPTFNLGRTSVDDLLRSNPMGSTSSTDNSRTVTQQNPTTVNVYGATDPQATASAVTRGVSSAHDMSLRNVQTAIR